MITDDTELIPLHLTHGERMALIECVELAKEVKERRSRNAAAEALADHAVRMEEASDITHEEFAGIIRMHGISATLYQRLHDLAAKPRVAASSPNPKQRYILDGNDDNTQSDVFTSPFGNFIHNPNGNIDLRDRREDTRHDDGGMPATR
jgi:hypothetical protein